MIKPEYIVAWMNFIRNHPEDKRFLECFWESQIKSKNFLINEIKKYDPKNVVVFGGWYGVFAQMLESYIEGLESITTLDHDPTCWEIFSQIDVGYKINMVIECMSKFKEYDNIDMAINTSTEHVLQDVYDGWWENIPTGMRYVIQGNNFDSIDEHIRCADNLDIFLEINHVKDPIMTEVIDCNGFERYMAIAIK